MRSMGVLERIDHRWLQILARVGFVHALAIGGLATGNVFDANARRYAPKQAALVRPMRADRPSPPIASVPSGPACWDASDGGVGLGARGPSLWGGGLSMNSVGLGALGTAGRDGGQGGYGEGVGGLGMRAHRDINISAGSPIIMGSLDKLIIRRVIKQHLAQIRYCYEKELTRSPGLFGKVATEFTISKDGDVTAASVSQSTLNNSEVEQCITSKIRTWVFPKPKGGGVVIVKYPFIFKTTS
jgi:TonB family protein